jgi:hypothetical protein
MQRIATSLLSFLFLIVGSTHSFTPFSSQNTFKSERFMVASTESTSTTNQILENNQLPKGMGGRIEDAFAAAKERGESAFVSFITAGYPTAQGMLHS